MKKKLQDQAENSAQILMIKPYQLGLKIYIRAQNQVRCQARQQTSI
jgi:hypothetical protein